MSRRTGSSNRREPPNPPFRAGRGLLRTGISAMAIGGAAMVFRFVLGMGAAEPPRPPVPIRAAAHNVGSTACVSCHNNQASEWRTSQHHQAMAEASEHNVLGNFND